MLPDPRAETNHLRWATDSNPAGMTPNAVRLGRSSGCAGTKRRIACSSARYPQCHPAPRGAPYTQPENLAPSTQSERNQHGGVESEEQTRGEDLERTAVHKRMLRGFSVEVHDGDDLRYNQSEEAERVESVEPQGFVWLHERRDHARDDEDEEGDEDLQVRVRQHRARERYRELANHYERFPRNDDAGSVRGVPVEEECVPCAHICGGVRSVLATHAKSALSPSFFIVVRWRAHRRHAGHR